MRHGKKFNHLSRKPAHRKAMLSNMACSLIEHKRINTTVAKAKALRMYIEPLLTKSKTDSTHSRRIVFKYLQSKDAVTHMFRDVAPKIADRPGGYTRIIRTGNRLGDNAEMCLIELVDFNELMLADTADKKTTRRSRRGGKKKSSDATTASKETASTEETKEATPKAEAKKETPSDKEAPKTDAKKDAPKAEAKKTEAKKEAPKAEAKKETAKKDAPKAEAKKDAPKKETPKAEAKKEEAPKKEKDDKKDAEDK